MAIIEPGNDLSQPATGTTPSKRSAKHTVSIESAITSRLTSDPFIPSVPMEIASDTVIVPNMNGVPLDSDTPRFTSSTSGAIPKLHTVTSLCIDATPTNGWLISLSDKPIARIIDRCGARIAPSVVSHDRHFPSARLAGIFLPGVVVVT